MPPRAKNLIIGILATHFVYSQYTDYKIRRLVEELVESNNQKADFIKYLHEMFVKHEVPLDDFDVIALSVITKLQ